MNATLELLKRRRSVPPAFLAEPGPDAAELDALLTIGSRVPDHGKLAPWRFILFRGEARLAAGERLADLLRARDPETGERRLDEERQRLARAPLVILVASRAADHVKIPLWEQELSAGAVCFALEVAAHAMGYAATWLTEWVSYDAEAAAVLGVRDGERIAGLIHIGTPTLAPEDRPRPPLASIITDWA